MISKFRRYLASRHSLVYLDVRRRRHVGDRGRRVGYFLASFDRPRHVLDARAYGDLHVRRACGHRQWLSDPVHDLRIAAAALRESSIGMWGFRGPLGAFVAAWGGIAMLVSAPFDNWWHNAYGLDVKIISPPHALLFLGNAAIQMGGLMLILGLLNRASGALRGKLDWLLLYAGGMLALLVSIFIMSYSFPNQMHSAMSYRAACDGDPVRAGRDRRALRTSAGRRPRWRASTCCSRWPVSGSFRCFPRSRSSVLFTHTLRNSFRRPFRFCSIVPALLLDFLREKMAGRDQWLQAGVLGTAFLGTDARGRVAVCEFSAVARSA